MGICCGVLGEEERGRGNLGRRNVVGEIWGGDTKILGCQGIFLSVREIL